MSGVNSVALVDLYCSTESINTKFHVTCILDIVLASTLLDSSLTTLGRSNSMRKNMRKISTAQKSIELVNGGILFGKRSDSALVDGFVYPNHLSPICLQLLTKKSRESVCTSCLAVSPCLFLRLRSAP